MCSFRKICSEKFQLDQIQNGLLAAIIDFIMHDTVLDHYHTLKQNGPRPQIYEVICAVSGSNKT